jgi:hypothetical protein
MQIIVFKEEEASLKKILLKRIEEEITSKRENGIMFVLEDLVEKYFKFDYANNGKTIYTLFIIA